MYFGSSGLLCLRFCYVSFTEHRERLDIPLAHCGFKISPAFSHFLALFVQDKLCSDISRHSCTTVAVLRAGDWVPQQQVLVNYKVFNPNFLPLRIYLIPCLTFLSKTRARFLSTKFSSSFCDTESYILWQSLEIRHTHLLYSGKMCCFNNFFFLLIQVCREKLVMLLNV